MDAASKTDLLANQALALQFLAWVAATPRSYRETIEAWRTSCPRLTIWEDCRDAGLIAIRQQPGGGMPGNLVELTDAGRAHLARYGG